VRGQLQRLKRTEFGRTQRGQLVLGQVARLLTEDRIVFSARLGNARGLSWHEVLGEQVVFVKALELGRGQYLHLTEPQIMEVLGHEAIHWLNKHYQEASLEEECDAFAAGLYTEAAALGVEPPAHLTMSGIPLVTFVTRKYPDSRHDPDYVPVGTSSVVPPKAVGVASGRAAFLRSCTCPPAFMSRLSAYPAAAVATAQLRSD
jgi:hypothetical protein